MLALHSGGGQRDVGCVRKHAEQPQEINKLYKLSSGDFVSPEILMSRLLALPPSYDSVIERWSGMRAFQGRDPLDFHEVPARVVQYENRCPRRNRQTRREVPLQRPQGDRRQELPEGAPRMMRRRKQRRGRACDMQGQKGQNGPCFRVGNGPPCTRVQGRRERHRSRMGTAAGGTGAVRAEDQPSSATAARQRYGKGRKKPPAGLLCVEQPAKLRDTKGGRAGSGGNVVIDNGASGHICVTGTKLGDTRATRRVINSAGHGTLAGKQLGMGDA